MHPIDEDLPYGVFTPFEDPPGYLMEDLPFILSERAVAMAAALVL